MNLSIKHKVLTVVAVSLSSIFVAMSIVSTASANVRKSVVALLSFLILELSYSSPVVASDRPIEEIIAQTFVLQTEEALVVYGGAVQDLRGPIYTALLAWDYEYPNKKAFGDLSAHGYTLSWQDLTQDIVWRGHTKEYSLSHYHKGSAITREDLSDGESIDIEMMDGSVRQLKREGSRVRIDGERNIGDTAATNGHVYLIEHLFVPEFAKRDVLQTIEELPNSTTFFNLANQGDAQAALRPESRYGTGMTVFVPSDDAMSQLDFELCEENADLERKRFVLGHTFQRNISTSGFFNLPSTQRFASMGQFYVPEAAFSQSTNTMSVYRNTAFTTALPGAIQYDLVLDPSKEAFAINGVVHSIDQPLFIPECTQPVLTEEEVPSDEPDNPVLIDDFDGNFSALYNGIYIAFSEKGPGFSESSKTTDQARSGTQSRRLKQIQAGGQSSGVGVRKQFRRPVDVSNYSHLELWLYAASIDNQRSFDISLLFDDPNDGQREKAFSLKSTLEPKLADANRQWIKLSVPLTLESFDYDDAAGFDLSALGAIAFFIRNNGLAEALTEVYIDDIRLVFKDPSNSAEQIHQVLYQDEETLAGATSSYNNFIDTFLCPANQVIAGLDFGLTYDSAIIPVEYYGGSSVRFYCATLERDGSLTGLQRQDQFATETYPEWFGQYSPDIPLPVPCDGLITGLRGESADNPDIPGYSFINILGHYCSSISQVSTSQYDDLQGNPVDFSSTSAPKFTQRCETGKVATGAEIYVHPASAGDGIERVENILLICSDISSLPVDGDQDGDGHRNLVDNCPYIHNENQTDTDGDDLGDSCEYDFDVCFLSSDEIGPGKSGLCPSTDTGLTRGERLVSENGDYFVSINKGLTITEIRNGAQIIQYDPRDRDSFRTQTANLTDDGNFQLFDSSGNVLWSTDTVNSNANYMYLGNDGELYMECVDGAVVWSSDSNAETVESCDISDTVYTQKSIEMGLKNVITTDLLCQTEDDIAALCPSGKRYQLLSVEDSFLTLSNQSDLEQDLAEGFLESSFGQGGAGFVKFFVDAWSTDNVANLQCLDRDSSSSFNSCYINRATVDQDSLLTTWPSGAVYSNDLALDADTTAVIPNLDIGGNKYILNTCHRHITNEIYLDTVADVESLASDKDAFVQRYFPKVDCLLDARVENSVIGQVSEYSDKATAWLATGVQVAQFVDEAAIFTVGAVALGGGASILLAGTELEFLLVAATELAETAGPAVNVAMAVHGIWTEFGELESCITDVCKNRVLTDMAINVITLGLEAKGAADRLGRSKVEAKAEGISKSALSLEAEAGRPGGIWEDVTLSQAQKNHYRLMTLIGLDPNIARIAQAAVESGDFRYIDALLGLPEDMFKDPELVRDVVRNADAAVEPDGSINSSKLEEAIDHLEDYNEFIDSVPLSEAGCL